MWAPAKAGWENPCTSSYGALKESLTDDCISLVASQKGQLDYRQLVALAS